MMHNNYTVQNGPMEGCVMTVQQLIERASSGRFFTVEFIKRTTGELRVMTCRLGVSKGVTGKGMAFDPASKGLLPVYDVQTQGYRMINLSGLRAVRMDGERFTFEGEAA
jgi:hypothetical protein